MSAPQHVLLAYPTAWDRPQLAACRDAWRERFEPLFGEPSDEASTWDEDALAWVDRVEAVYASRASRASGAAVAAVAGVASSSDYPGAIVAGELARRLQLPGAPPAALIRAGHKWYSRVAQQQAVPEATPRFALLDPARPEAAGAAVAAAGLSFPVWVKPVKGAFSVMASRIESASELAAFLTKPAATRFLDTWVPLFDRLLHGLTDLEIDGRHFIAEELLAGAQVTVEGFVERGQVSIFGVVDSIVDARTGSFTRFEYPSSLPEAVQARMADIAARAVRGLELDHVLFNVELFWDAARDRITIIEINPRIAGQFGDLYLKVDGASSYEHLLAVAAGERVRLPRRGSGRFACAASVPLRVFEPVRVVAAPGERELAAVRAAHPDVLVWVEVRAGQELSDFASFQDGSSHRYGVVNLGADRPQALRSKLEQIERQLGFGFEALDSAPPRIGPPATVAGARSSGPRPSQRAMTDVTESFVLLRRAQQGDGEALNRLFARYYDRIRVVARLRMGDRLKGYEDPDDIVQKAFIAAVGALPNFEPRNEGSLLRWFSKLVERQITDAIDWHHAGKRDRRREQALDDLRKATSDGSISIDLSASDTLPPDRAGRRAELAILAVEFQRLSKEHQDVWCARFLDPDSSWDEIAEAVGSENGGAARSLWNRATAKLAAAMAQREREV